MFHTRQELINWVYKNVNDPVIQHLLEWGQIRNLGGFAPLPTSENPGWVVELVSRFGKKYYIAIGIKNYQPYWLRLKKVDWSTWIGGKSEDELYRGDNDIRPDKII